VPISGSFTLNEIITTFLWLINIRILKSLSFRCWILVAIFWCISRKKLFIWKCRKLCSTHWCLCLKCLNFQGPNIFHITMLERIPNKKWRKMNAKKELKIRYYLSYTNKHQSKEREYWSLFTSGYRGRRDLYSKYLLTVVQLGQCSQSWTRFNRSDVNQDLR
jgi:hypothetical protein